MTDIKQEEMQQELFGEFGSQASKQKPRFPSLHKAQKPVLLSTSLEQILLVSILLILAACVVFFLGILRGKSMAATGGVVPMSTQPLPRKTTQVLPPRAAPRAGLGTSTVKTATPKDPAWDLGKPYTIQLATFKKQDMAEREVDTIRKKGFQAFIIASGDYYEVCSGQYVSKEDAGRDKKLFSARYKDCFIRRR